MELERYLPYFVIFSILIVFLNYYPHPPFPSYCGYTVKISAENNTTLKLYLPLPINEKGKVVLEKEGESSAFRRSFDIFNFINNGRVVETEKGVMFEIETKLNSGETLILSDVIRSCDVELSDPFNNSVVLKPAENITKTFDGRDLSGNRVRKWEYYTWVYRESGANLTVKLEYDASTSYSTWRSLLGFILQNGHYEITGEAKIPKGNGWVKVKLDVRSEEY